ncbi:MAG: hypothetical protein ABFS86_19870 [Planctomycetota bacterium]
MLIKIGAALLLLLSLVAPAAAGTITISEVLYDATGADDGKVFVEIWGKAGTDLSGIFLQGVNGADGKVTHSVDLKNKTIPTDGFFVVADCTSTGSCSVSSVDMTVSNFDLQNGPDSVRLWTSNGVLDALAYGTPPSSGYFGGESKAAADVAAGSSLARTYANVDTDDNLADFKTLTTPTPGSGTLKVVAVPLPESAGLGAAGLLLMAVMRRRRRSVT